MDTIFIDVKADAVAKTEIEFGSEILEHLISESSKPEEKPLGDH